MHVEGINARGESEKDLMMYEFSVSQMAAEFDVHRNTIRNWIKSGVLPARKGPGKRYLVPWEYYNALCKKYGRTPAKLPEPPAQQDVEQPEVTEPAALELSGATLKEPSLIPDPTWGTDCITCGSCAGGCPIAGVDGLDPRKIVRMAVLNMQNELVESRWAWKCTMCARCEVACPMNIEITKLMRRIRSITAPEKIPGPLHKGVLTCLERGNNLGIPKEDFLLLLEDLGKQMAAETWEGFTPQIDVRGAKLMVTVNSKEPFADPEDLTHWWKIFHAAGESWTVPSENWEGVNWGLFSGDDRAMKAIVGRIVDNMRRLNCEALLLPE